MMEVHFSIAVVLFSLLFESSVCDVSCFKCDESMLPSSCQYVTQCGPHEVCQIEEYLSSSGLTRYRQGCKDQKLCSSSNKSRNEIVFCSECCEGALCNSAGCGIHVPERPIDDDLGPVCFDCEMQIGIHSCDKVKQCERDEICQIQPIHRLGAPKGLKLFKSGCVSKRDESCSTGNIQAASCRSECCTNSLCNNYDPNVCPIVNTTPYSTPFLNLNIPTETTQTTEKTTTNEISTMSTALTIPDLLAENSKTDVTTAPVKGLVARLLQECTNHWDLCPDTDVVCSSWQAQYCCPKLCGTCDTYGAITTPRAPPCFGFDTTVIVPETTTVSGFICRDLASGCDSLPRDVYCIGEDEAWARQQCKKTCGYCT